MSILTTGVQITKRGFLVAVILFLTFFSWYYVFSLFVLQHVVGPSDETYLIVGTSFNFIIAVTLLFGSFFIHRFNETHTIYKCSLATSIVTLLLLFTSSTVLRLMIAFMAGIFFSVSQLAGFTYFWNLTTSEERGRTAGLIGFFALPIFYILVWTPEQFDFFTTVTLCIVLSSGPLILRLLGSENKAVLTTKKDESCYRPEKRTILLYSVPWVLFSLINATLARNMSLYVFQSVPFSYYMSLVILQLVTAVFGALGGGIIADFFGRRLSLISSLTLFGIASALVGLVENYEVFLFVYTVNGLNWGILWTLYVLVVWGDLADKESCAKRYSVGLIIFYLSQGVGILLTHQVSQISLIVSSLVSCLLIFLSNIPLLLALELSPSDFRERIKLRLHMGAVKRIGRKPSQNQG